MASGNEIYKILQKALNGKITDNEIKTLSDAIDGIKSLKSISSEDSGAEASLFDVEGLKKYNENIKDLNNKIQEIINKQKEGKDISEKDVKTIKEKLTQLTKEERAREKIRELSHLENKAIKEGLTWEEKRYKLLTKFGEQLGVNTDKFKNGVEELKKGFNDSKDVISKFNQAWASADQAASKYTRTIGGSKASMEALRKSTIDFMEARSIGVKYNTSMEELIKLQGDYNASIGRSIDLTNDQKETFAALKETLQSDQAAIEFTTKLENFGLNPDEVGERVGQMFSKASKSGVAFEKYSKNFLDNIKLAQNYNFKNGLRGLESMAKKATEIKMDMQQVARFADKVSTLEGAVQAGANLSVLGGSFAQFGNPLQMLYEGLNDMEGLQDRMINMFGKLGKWDYTKGQVDVSVFNKQRIKAAAEATGMDYSTLMEQINAGARRNIVKGKLGDRYSGDKDFEDLLLNKAQLDEKGNAFVTIRGERKDINSLSKEDQNYLKTSNTSDSDNIAEIAVNTRGYKDVKEGLEKQGDVAETSLNEMTGIGKITKESMAWLGERSGLLKAIKAINPVMGITNSLLTSINGLLLIINSKVGAGGIGAGVGRGKNGFGIGGKFGSKYNYTMHKNGMASVPGTSGFVKPTAGMKFMKGVGRFGGIGGAALGAAGMLGEMAIDNSEWGKNRSEHANAYGWAKAGTGALAGMGTGAMIGSMFGPVGTLVGAGVGLLGGALYSGISGYKEAQAEANKKQIAENLRSLFNATINDPNVYSVNELALMKGGSNSLPMSLKQKMANYGDNLGGHAFGGSVKEGITGPISGNGGPREDKVAMYASPGEYIVNAESAVKYRPELDFINAKKYSNGGSITPNGNEMNTLQVSNNSLQNTIDHDTTTSMKIEPININLSGDLKIGGEKVDPQKVLDAITPQLIDRINDGLVDRRNFRIDRNKTHMKFKTV